MFIRSPDLLLSIGHLHSEIRHSSPCDPTEWECPSVFRLQTQNTSPAFINIQIACIRLLPDLTGISLGEAKEAVHYSPAWADRRDSNEALHEATFRAATDLGFAETS